MDKPRPPEHLDRVDFALAALAGGAGSMDAVGFFALGGALPSAMTGNTALLGLALGRGTFDAATAPLAAGIGFVLGTALAVILLHLGLERLPASRAAGWLLAVETVPLAGFLLLWLLGGPSVGGPSVGGPALLIILLGAGSMGIQGVAARREDRHGISTVVFTSTLMAIVIGLTSAMLARPHRVSFAVKRQIFAYLGYGLGALAGGLLSWLGTEAMALIPPVAVVAGFFLYLRAHRS
jgi:uncharacterized membrane protein YoaK (UPF0700 family)